MSKARSDLTPAARPRKENHRMTKRPAFTLGLLCAVAVLATVAASATAAPSPWWQVLPGSHPSNLWEPTDNVQEIETETGEIEGFEGVIAPVEVEGKTIGCLAQGVGSFFCQEF